MTRMPSERQADVAELFERERKRLFSIAYRMLGSVSEAEDVVQETFTRYAREDRSDVSTPQAYLTTAATRIAIDQIRESSSARESYIGPWLPEPLVDEKSASPADEAELTESVSIAFLVLLETLNPVERAIFLLREAFDYDYREIAAIVDRSPQNCRQIAHRARKYVEARRPRFEPSRARRDELARRFFAACDEGDLESLLELLSEDVVMVGDGGGRAPAIRKPIVGAERVARTLLAFASLAERVQAHYEPVLVNGQPGVRYLTADGRLANVVALDIGTDGIRAIHGVTNPAKLEHLGDVADAAALLRDSRPPRSSR
jgi:RNA polymerase sigma-70 factor (TIGR02957 family)